MKALSPAALLLLLAGTGLAAGPPPVITGVDQNPLVSMSKLTIYGLTIYGRNFWLSGPNDPSRRVLSMRRQGQPFQTIRIDSMNNTVIDTEFPTKPWLEGLGTLDIMVKIDGLNSNIFSVPVVADPPKLDSVSPVKITMGSAADWKVWLRGSRWIPDTSIWINGTNVGNCFQNLNSGQEQLTWPASLRKPGRYSVLVLTEHGPSDVRTVDVVAAPTPTPAFAIAKDRAVGAAAMTLKPTPTHTPAYAILKNRTGGAAAAILKPTATPTPEYVRLKNP